ncbi:S8 family serine peptidase [Pseudomonas sp. Marseille-P9899]|uniref:S8 family serine peptidase n=1 Tax=Pseudomonas sp. Marseille-P9899 TaxID=2730401 RepID=UPI0021156AC6|nr:S8 family serine peptidase [Pseudomonas sp. Marseille-P9899]
MKSTLVKQGQFGPDDFFVQARDGTEVAAKWLEDGMGNYIVDPHTELPYKVPASYDLAAVIKKYEGVRDRIMSFPSGEEVAKYAEVYDVPYKAFRQGGEGDLQRSYNEVVGGNGERFVRDFTNSASFNFGLVGSVLGVSQAELIAGGGAYNLWNSLREGGSYINTSGEFWNNPENVVSIKTGVGLVRSDRNLNYYWNDFSGNPALEEILTIEITPSLQPQQQILDEDRIRDDVSSGFVDRRGTHSIAFNDGTLDKTDFTSVQMGSFATGGIRPGELQPDPNVQPAAYLSRFYKDGKEDGPADFSLRNAVSLNGLAALTTVNTFVDPLLLDLTGLGAGMTPLSDGVLFDADNSGLLRRTGWADPQTGMLVRDDGSGVSNISQLFSEYYAGRAGADGAPGERPHKDGFAALASEDSNADGAINSQDPIWSQLRVWVDSSQDGRADAGELKTPDELGISAIRVDQVSPVGELRHGNQVIARSTFSIQGVEREVLAVNFLSDTVSNQVISQDGGSTLVSTAQGITRRAFVGQSSTGETLDASALGVDNLYGGSGDDVLKAAVAGSWLVGGQGSNTYVGGAGDDVFVISASDDQRNIKGNGGRDTLLIVGDQGVGLNMAEAGLTIAQGGRGKDIIASGGGRGVFIKGGSGDSTLIGGAGNDVLAGGAGRNTIIGGSGKAVIYAGPQGDTIIASDAGSIIYAGGGADRIQGGPADDVIEAGRGDAQIDGAGGINLVSLHGSHDQYLIGRTGSGYEVTDKVAGRDGKLTLTNIQKLGFSDLSSVDLDLPNALPIADIVDAAPNLHAAGQLIPAAALVGNDQPLNSSGALRISTLSDARGATVSLNEQGDVLVLPVAGHTGVISFKYDLVDAQGNPSASVVSLDTGASAPMRAMVTLREAGAPVDPLAARQWYLEDVNVLPVWGDYSGKGVRIGQFEPGGRFAVSPEIFDIHHPDLQTNVDPAWLQTQRASGALPTVVSNHATQVAGVMVAARNTEGGVGIAYEATLGGYYLANSGEDLTSLGQMINYDIANNSWGFTNDFARTSLQGGLINTSTALAANARYAAGNGRGGLGTIIVAAGGNAREKGGSAQGSLTNNNRFTIEVGAINAKADLSTLQVASAPFSNPGTSLLVSAPGSHVFSSSHSLEAERGARVGNAYSATQGTSFAAPIVSGVVALMLQANPNLGYRDVQQILALSARRVDDPNTEWRFNGSRNWNGGGQHVSDDYGFGLVDARAAVRLAESWIGQATAANEKVLAASSAVLGQSVGPNEIVRLSLPMASGVQIEHVEIDIDAQVARLGDLTLKLISPSGTPSLLLARSGKAPGSGDNDLGSAREGEFRYTFMSTHDRGEASGGDWTLEVSNAGNGLPVALNSWGLRVSGKPVTHDDTYFYTDEYALVVSGQAERGVLDDAVNGQAGGRNTLNAAAVSGDVLVDLGTGVASISGTGLTLANGGIQNLISGDGNDTLVAAGEDALLDAGRGQNRLVGGTGKDVFVVHRRAGGQDALEHFEAGRDVVELIGFSGKQFGDLLPESGESGFKLGLGNGQYLMFPGQIASAVGESDIRFRDTFVAPAHYVDSSIVEQPADAPGVVLLNGGGGGVSYSTDATGQFVASLSGTVYSRDNGAKDVFVVVRQEGVDNYRNALRGFRHGIDKIDLSQTGISSFDALDLSKVNRATINGLSQIHGVSVRTSALGDGAKPVELLYLDTLELAQISREDFIFADAGQALAVPVVTEGDSAQTAQLLVARAELRALPDIGSLIDSMAAFALPSSAGFFPRGDQALAWQPTLAVSA